MSQNPQETLGDRMARLRRMRGWNQIELAERAGCTGAQISKYERGASAPRPEALSRFAEVLGTTVDYLLTGREPDTARDSRLRDLLPALDSLPKRQRDNVVEFLDSLLKAHLAVSLYGKRQAGQEPQAGAGRRSKSGRVSF